MNLNRKLTATLLLLTLGLSACTTSTPAGNTPTPGNPVPTDPGNQPTAGDITGTVVSAQGQPLRGVEVVADNTLGYNSNLITHTDAQGHYKISVNGMPTTFNVSAKMTLNYPPYNPRVALVPDGDSVVPGNVGGVVNFTMKPDESKPYGNLGALSVQVGVGYGGTVDYSKVRITMTPVGLLADGTGGEPLTLTLKQLYGWWATNIMYGTYTVTATEDGRALDLRRKGNGSAIYGWDASYTGGFVKEVWAPDPVMYLEVRPHGVQP